MNKKVLRELFLEKRTLLTPKEHKFRSEQVCRKTIQFLEKSQAVNIHLFLPISRFAEVNTWPIYEYLCSNTQKSPITSTCDFSSSTLKHHQCDKNTEFLTNKYGIPEPINGKTIESKQLDLVLVPLISFDRIGNRIGYGGGFYDIFLKQCSPKTKRVGLAITPPLDKIDYIEIHDERLDFCLTHHDLYNFIN